MYLHTNRSGVLAKKSTSRVHTGLKLKLNITQFQANLYYLIGGMIAR